MTYTYCSYTYKDVYIGISRTGLSLPRLTTYICIHIHTHTHDHLRTRRVQRQRRHHPVDHVGDVREVPDGVTPAVDSDGPPVHDICIGMYSYGYICISISTSISYISVCIYVHIYRYICIYICIYIYIRRAVEINGIPTRRR